MKKKNKPQANNTKTLKKSNHLNQSIEYQKSSSVKQSAHIVKQDAILLVTGW